MKLEMKVYGCQAGKKWINSMKIKTTKFTFFFRLSWFATIISIMFINTENRIMVYSVIAVLLILTSITVIRSLESRNQWRRMIEDGEVEVKDKISFD